jgi:hypothetical protein
MRRAEDARQNWARALALGLSLLVFLFVLQAPHAHRYGQDDTACQLCQVAHLGFHPAVAAPALPAPLLAAGRVQPLVLALRDTPLSLDGPSRAPPSA